MTELMVLVERAVRPVRAGPAQKMRMRDELLAHLTGIYEEEKARLGDDRAALARAAERFGDPAGLTRELQDSLAFRDRVDAALDRWFGWRPPESAARYTLRLAGLVFLVMLPFGLLPALATAATRRAAGPSDADLAVAFRTWAALLVVGTADVFLFGWLYYQVRDALHGTPWAAKSRVRAAGYAALYVPVFLVSAVGLYLATTLDIGQTVDIFETWNSVLVCGGGAVCAVFIAFKQGPAEISHTIWSSLDLGACATNPV